MEPALAEAQENGVIVVRLTGLMTEVEEDITYPIAVAPEGKPGVGTGHEALLNALSGMHDAMLVKNGRLLWHGHVGVIDDDLQETMKQIMKGAVLPEQDLATTDVVFH